MEPRDIIPTGHCWCGCGTPTGLGVFFVDDHEAQAAIAVIILEYESVAAFLLEHGFGPEGRSAIEELRG